MLPKNIMLSTEDYLHPTPFLPRMGQMFHHIIFIIFQFSTKMLNYLLINLPAALVQYQENA